MGAADRDGHPPDANGERVAAERPEVERLDRNPLVKAELAQTPRFAFAKRSPIDRRDVRAGAELEIVEGGRRRHCD